MTEEGKYLYCIIKENKEKRFDSIGLGNREVNLLHYKDIAAVISSIPVISFDRLDKEELTRHITDHEKVQEQVMSAKGGSASGGKGYDIVPMAFGIIAPSADEVLRILERAYFQFKLALKKITGKAEFVVQVWWDQKKLLEELINTNPEIQRLKQEISLKAGILGTSLKLKLGKLIQQEAEAYREASIKDIQSFLSDNLAYDYTFNKLIEDEMIANFSFLIAREKESEIDRKMQELGEKYEGKLRFKYIGPMPAYSFVNINLSLGNFELIDQARKTLKLAEEATFDEIKKSYRTLAHQYHPDKYQGDLEKVQEMKKITQAYSILENYCQSYDDFIENPNPKYSFKEEDVKNSLIIK